MWITKAMAYLVLLFIIVVFSVQNATDKITLRFFNLSTGEIPAIEALILAFFMGLVVCGAYALWKYFSLLKKYKNVLGEYERMKHEIGVLRKMNIEEDTEKEIE